MALRDPLLCPKYRPPNPYHSARNGRNASRNLAVSATAAAPRTRRRRPQNVEGEFFVDHRCIDCDACRWMAPEIFTRIDEQSAVIKQPSCEEERIKALQALLSCPTSSIHTEKPMKKILEVQKMFPLPVDEQTLPGDVEAHTADVEMQLNGDGPWSIGTDFELIHTPGHTEGSVCLYYKPLKVLFTGDHLAKSGKSELTLYEMYNRQSVSLQLKSIRKLLELDFEWILPGHGRRIKFRDNREKNTVLEAFLNSKERDYA